MIRSVRLNLFSVTVTLICIGIIMIYSSSSIYTWQLWGDSFFFLKRQLVFIFIGLIFTFLLMAIDYAKLKLIAKPLLIVSFVLLVLVLIPGFGREVSGAQRWFRFKFISFQPAELANLAVIIYVADFISRKEKQMRMFWKGFMPPMFVLGMTAMLMLLQPDLGTAVSIGIAVIAILFIAGVRMSYLLSLFLISLPALSILIFSVPYRRMRIMAFLNPWLDPKGSGFQIIQSQIALGSGGIFGLGLGHSKQKLFYLPAAHTDFIFSIIGEELGLLGTVGVIMLFVIFIQQAVRLIRNTADKFGYFLSIGLTLMICLKAVINIGVSCGLLPTKGLPLPFVSYGGSSLMFDMVSVGILLNIGRTGEYP